ncbi:MAG TPA: glutathione S-transferase family protein [Hyphomicrobiales bacterium]|nr:glutathione S-transferase family protein [Hyphomicrobiales bacterium]
MGLLVHGEWQDRWYDTEAKGGRFQRQDSRFRDWVTADGGPGPDGRPGLPAEAGRYHLYVSLACPWASRALALRKLKKLDDVISVDVVDPHMGAEGWVFGDFPRSTPDTVNGKTRLYEVYRLAAPDYSGRVTVPVLWDRKRGTIVNNESADIVRMLNSAFDAFTDVRHDYCPPALREEIDRVNARVYDDVNNGVYKAGFATTQEAYAEAARALFKTLDWLEARLSQQRWLVGHQQTEADCRLFTTLVRFDPVYYVHFKCNLRQIGDYPNLSNYLRDLYQTPGIRETVDFNHIKTHYYWSHTSINPHRIIPIGPEIDLDRPHDRDRLG